MRRFAWTMGRGLLVPSLVDHTPHGDVEVLGAAEADRQLVRRCLLDEEDAWRELLNRFARLSRAVAARVLGREGASHVADAVQEAWMAVFLHLGDFRGASDRSLAAWLAATATRRAAKLRDRLQRQRAAEQHAVAERTHHEAGAGGGGDRWALGASEARVAAKHELPPRTQLVLEGLVGGKTQREIAVALGVSETTVWNEVQEIRGRTGEILEKLQDSGGH
jgi:RNA polymerase sigma factor (sigma-70 family)